MDKNSFINYLIELRHKLHKIPERGTNLPLTTEAVCLELDSLGIGYRIVKDGGIIAPFGQGEHAIVLRADVDALPISERSGEEFASTNGCMHACGHDLHTTMLIGAAMLLKERESELKCKVILVFEYGEEIGIGMKTLVDEKVFDGMKIDHAMALHCLPGKGMAPGTYVCHEGPANSSFTMFDIKVTGKTAHGAMPFKGRNPINACVQIYNAITNLVMFETDARKTALVSPCYFTGGSPNSKNVVPEEAGLGGTIRTLSTEDTTHIGVRIREIAEHISQGLNMECEVSFASVYPSAVNASETVRLANETAAELGMRNLDLPPQMVSDTFAFLSEMVPGVYIWIGAGGDDPKYCDGVLHSPEVCYNDDTLYYGAKLFANAVLRYNSELG